jgi:hypothetical protein
MCIFWYTYSTWQCQETLSNGEVNFKTLEAVWMLPLVCRAQALAGQNLVDDLTTHVSARAGHKNQLSLGMGFRVTQHLAWLEAAPNQTPLLMRTTLFGKGNPNEDKNYLTPPSCSDDREKGFIENYRCYARFSHGVLLFVLTNIITLQWQLKKRQSQCWQLPCEWGLGKELYGASLYPANAERPR